MLTPRIAKCLHDKFVQAVEVINKYTPDVNAMLQRLGIDADTVRSWIREEARFLKDLKVEPDERVLECSYLEALIALREVEYVQVLLLLFFLLNDVPAVLKHGRHPFPFVSSILTRTMMLMLRKLRNSKQSSELSIISSLCVRGPLATTSTSWAFGNDGRLTIHVTRRLWRISRRGTSTVPSIS